MRLIRFAVLYTALAFGANTAAADTAALEALREGDMRKLNFHAEAKALPEVTLLDAEDAPHTLAEYRGRLVLLNFWATWCAPCQIEMPALEQAYQERKDEGLVVLAVNRDEDRGAVERFFYVDLELSFTALLDEEARVNDMYRVFNLPTTVFVDGDGVIRAVHRGVLTQDLIDSYLHETMS